MMLTDGVTNSSADSCESRSAVHSEVVGKVAEPSRLCSEQRRDAAATLLPL